MTQGGTVCLFYVHESMIFFKFCGLSWTYFVPWIARCVHEFATFDPKKESNFTIIWEIVEKMWLFFHPESAILPLEGLPGG